MESKPPVATEPHEGIDVIYSELHKHAQYKERSNTTHDRDHAAVLAQGKPITCLLLGHSFFERFKTTGESTQFGPDRASYPDYFNAGVGGDKISNIIFRLTDKGLLKAIEDTGVKYALLAMGTNDLANDKKSLQQHHIEQYTLVIRALQQASPGIKILVCGIAPKKRVGRQGVVEESNQMLQRMIGNILKDEPDSIGKISTPISYLQLLRLIYGKLNICLQIQSLSITSNLMAFI